MEYTITFNSCGGSSVPSITQNHGTSITAPANPTRTGYTFDGWSPAVPTTMPSKDMTCSATWEVNTYTITWNGMGGNPSREYDMVDYNSKIEDLPAASKSGYMLQGWFTRREGGTQIQEPITVTGNKTYYARWVSLEDYVPDPDPDPDPEPEPEPDPTPTPVPTPEPDDPITEGEEPEDDPYPSDPQPEAEADFPRKGKYVVTFDPNGGTYSSGEETRSFTTRKTAQIGQVILEASANPPTRSGFAFNGWYTQPEDGERVFPTNTTPVVDVNGGSPTFYAHWVSTSGQKSVTITWNANGGNFRRWYANKHETREEHLYSGSDITFLQSDYDVAFGRGKHTFLGWYTEAKNGDKIDYGYTIPDDATSITFYAHWKRWKDDETITVYFDLMEGKFQTELSDVMFLYQKYSHIPGIFVKIKDITLEEIAEGIPGVTIHRPCITILDGTQIELPAATKEGCYLSQWNTEPKERIKSPYVAGQTYTITRSKTLSSGTMTLYAIWQTMPTLTMQMDIDQEQLQEEHDFIVSVMEDNTLSWPAKLDKINEYIASNEDSKDEEDEEDDAEKACKTLLSGIEMLLSMMQSPEAEISS